jgi:hypothetical protein
MQQTGLRPRVRGAKSQDWLRFKPRQEKKRPAADVNVKLSRLRRQVSSAYDVANAIQ